MAVTRLFVSVEDWSLSQDGVYIYYVTSKESQIEDDWKSLREEHNDLEYGYGPIDYSTLWKLNLSTWKHEVLWAEDKVIKYKSSSFCNSCNGFE